MHQPANVMVRHEGVERRRVVEPRIPSDDGVELAEHLVDRDDERTILLGERAQLDGLLVGPVARASAVLERRRGDVCDGLEREGHASDSTPALLVVTTAPATPGASPNRPCPARASVYHRVDLHDRIIVRALPVALVALSTLLAESAAHAQVATPEVLPAPVGPPVASAAADALEQTHKEAIQTRRLLADSVLVAGLVSLAGGAALMASDA